MNEYQLFQAIGHADDEYLNELEERKVLKLPCVLRRAGMVAAMIALLAVTVAATSGVLSALTDGRLSLTNVLYPYVSIYGPGTQGMTDGPQVLLKIDVDPDAPATLETPHLPTALLEDYPATRCEQAEYGLVYWSVYYYADGSRARTDIHFEQYAIPEWRSGTYNAIYRGIEDAKKESRMFEVDGIRVMEVTLTGSKTGLETRQLYWSDGMYIYYLLLPYDVEADFYESVITSVQPVEDITPYLTGVSKSLVEQGAEPTETN